MTKRTPVTRLDQALTYMEQELLLMAALQKLLRQQKPYPENLLPIPGLVGHYKELRQHLLEIRRPEEFDASRFKMEIDKALAENPYGDPSIHDYFVTKLAWWVTRSRRVYDISEDLQLMLLASSFGEKCCDEIPWPLETFGIKLGAPLNLVHSGKKHLSDFLLVSRPQKVPDPTLITGKIDLGKHRRHSIRLAAISHSLERATFLSEKECSSLETAPTAAKIRNAVRKLKLPGDAKNFSMPDGIELALPGPAQTRIEDALYVMDVSERHVGDIGRGSLWRLVVGLCFFQETLRQKPPEERVSYRTARKPKTLDLSAITETSEICTVASTHVLSPSTREQLREWVRRGGGYELPFHFRIEHMRRPWGTAHIPGQDKTVLIPMTMVNRERLPEGAQARGTKTVLHQ